MLSNSQVLKTVESQSPSAGKFNLQEHLFGGVSNLRSFKRTSMLPPPPPQKKPILPKTTIWTRWRQE